MKLNQQVVSVNQNQARGGCVERPYGRIAAGLEMKIKTLEIHCAKMPYQQENRMNMVIRNLHLLMASHAVR